MLTAVSGYYNGTEIVMDEQVPMNVGQRVIITILAPSENKKVSRNISLQKYVGRGEKMFHGDAGEYVKELRVNDRI